MDKKYLGYHVEDLIQDRDFASWVLRQKRNKEWLELISQYPEFGKTAKTARKIIHLLEDSHDDLSENDLYKLWVNIDRFENRQIRHKKAVRLQKVFRYAAVILLLVTISGLITLNYLTSSKSYRFTEAGALMQSSEAMLILSNGDEIRLKKDYSTIALIKGGIQINDDSLIHLRDVESKKMNEIIVPYGKRSQLVLEDGTKVWLNAGSRLAFPCQFNNNLRSVFLEGEAYFEVVRNEKLSFSVNVNDIEVRVLGTTFNVSAYSSDAVIETVLLEGSVTVRESTLFGFLKKEIMLKPNQKAIYSKEQKTTLVVNEPAPDTSTGWVKGWFSFSQQSLVNVLRHLQHFYNVKFEFGPDFTSKELITGKLDMKDSIENVLILLSDLAKVDFIITNNTVFVEKKKEELPMRN